MTLNSPIVRHLILCLGIATAWTQSAQARPLEAYVEKTTQFGRATQAPDGSVTMTAELIFRHTRYFTDYRRVCDTRVCGHDPIRRCNRHSCWIESVPRYCEVNCRMEPFTSSTTDELPSPCVAKFYMTNGTAVDPGKIKDFFLNSKTNSTFVQHVLHPELRSREWGYMLDGLEASDKTLIVMKSDAYQLVDSQDFLHIPAGFRAGDPIHVEVLIEPNSSRQKFSTEGTGFDFPPLHTRD